MDIYERLKRRDERYERYQGFVMSAFVRAVRNHLRGKVPKRLLDLGTGSGTAVIKLDALLPGTLSCGLDKKEAMVRLAAEKSAGNRGCYFLAGDVHNLPFQSNIFDCIIGKSSFCYWQSPLVSLAEIKRVMKKGGWGLFFELNPRSILVRLYVGLGLGNLIFRGLVTNEPYDDVFSSDFFFQRSYPAERIRQILHQAGVGQLRVQKKLLGTFYLIVFNFSPQKP